MAVFMLYVLPMFLGRTYDINTEQSGVDIFAKDDINKAWVIQKHQTDSRYTMVERSTDMRNFLDVTGSLALKIKGIGLQIEGAGGYLKDAAQKSHSIEILVRVHYETVTKTLRTTTKPLSEWANKKNLGTHYCRSITYGGDLIASVTFKAEKEEDREKIKAYVQGQLQLGGTFDASIQGKLEILQENLKGTASMEINYYATVPLHHVPRTIKGLFELTNKFSEHTKQINDGLGVPLMMELYPLSYLDSTFPTETENSLLTPYIDKLETQLDDLIATKQEINEWLGTLPPLQPPELINAITDFKKEIEGILTVFRQTITNLDGSANGRTEQFQPAFEKYRGQTTSLPDKYLRHFSRLKRNLETEYPEIRADFGGATYIHWGKDSCDNPAVETIYSGLATTSQKDALCVQLDTTLEKGDNIPGTATLVSSDLKCSLCQVNNRTVVSSQIGRSTCPDDWHKEYDGVLVENGDYICVNADLGLASHLAQVGTTCGVLPCERYNTGRSLLCAVCTK